MKPSLQTMSFPAPPRLAPLAVPSIGAQYWTPDDVLTVRELAVNDAGQPVVIGEGADGCGFVYGLDTFRACTRIV